MKNLKHVIVMLLCILLSLPVAQAQAVPDRQQEAKATNTSAQDVLIIIQQEKIRFTAPSAVEELQLQIFDPAGQLVYDSGAVSGAELIWSLQQASGETVKSGLYAYKLSLKEAGASEARVRRGHFIVDRARERDGQTDRLWITSQNDSGVGTELTVARNEGVTVAGTSASSDQKSVRTAETVTGGKESELTAAAAAIAGTAGRIAKFTSATDLGDSAMTELNGNIGIGTANPQGKLDVSGNIVLNGNTKTQLSASGDVIVAKGRGIELDASPNGSGRLGIGGNPGDNNVFLFGFSADRTRSANSMWFAGKDGGKLPLIQMSANDTFIDGPLRVAGNIVLNGNTKTQLSASGDVIVAKGRGIELDASPNGSGRLGIGGNPGDNNVFLFGFSADRTRSANSMWFAGKDGGKLPLIQMSADDTFIDGPLRVAGQTRTQTLQITGGADFAENFDVSLATTGSDAVAPKVEAGMVVSIDPASPGKLSLSTQVYDRRVAGIISGAGGVNPGMMMSQAGTLADGQHPVALSGRVYCWVDASAGAIEPGDLLTTSNTPGHAMKAADAAKAQGAIIGKAMTGLKEGKGLVLVLVTLQ